MHTFVVLLRGVMPVGKNKVPMAQLREALTAAGFGNVRTYIQSGNVLLDTDLTAGEVASRVHDIILQNIGPDIAVIVRSPAELQQAISALPFKAGHDPSRIFIAYFAAAPDAQLVAALSTQDLGDEELVVQGNTAYMYIPGTYGKGKLSNNALEKKLGVDATTRNLNTTNKLIGMAAHE